MEEKRPIAMKSSFSRPLESFNQRFAFDHDGIEADVLVNPEFTQGLLEPALYTSYEDLQRIFRHPKVQGAWCDLGCGVGKSVLMYADTFPERQAIGVEVVKSRLNTAEKLKERNDLKNAIFYFRDLLTCEIPVADAYFLYFPTGHILDRVLSELYHSKDDFHLVAIESHGDLFERLKLEEWLHLVDEIPLVSERHHPMARLFERRPGKKASDGHLQSFCQNILEIQSEEGVWLGESFGLTWQGNSQYLLQTPMRTIDWCQVSGIRPASEYSLTHQFLLALRHSHNLHITTTSGTFLGSIRKIFLTPGFSLEICSGQKIEWGSIQSISRGNTLCYDSSLSYFSLPLVP